MRAKAVNEVQNFERGQNPKRAIGIGGLDLSKDYQERIDEYYQAIDGITLSHTDEWKEYLKDTFIGKKITAELKKMPGINTKTGKTTGSHEKGDFTITVKDILPTWAMGDDFSAHKPGNPLNSSPPVLIVADMENNMYQMSMNQKIHFD